VYNYERVTNYIETVIDVCSGSEHANIINRRAIMSVSTVGIQTMEISEYSCFRDGNFVCGANSDRW
jgi:hypothetical protein